MRGWMVAIALVAACKNGKDAGKGTEVVQNTASTAVPTPKVSNATVLAKDDGKPPLLLIVDAAGNAQLAAAKTWADLDANKLQIAKKGAKLGILDRYVREDVGLGRDPLESVKSWNEMDGVDIDLSALDDNATKPTGGQDDPPPPPEDNDESGGTGTAMALDEGKMGKKDSDRAEGQYKMKKDVDPQLARQQAIDAAREAGILGSPTAAAMPGVFAGLGPHEDGTPSRVALAQGTVVKDGKLEPLRAMLFVAPTAKATSLIDAVRETGDAIAVSFNGKIRPLNLQFAMRDTSNILDSPYWIEARVSAKGVAVEAVPDKPIDVTALDQLGAAIEQARAARGRAQPDVIDVLVDADVDAQRLVDVVVAIDVAGAKVIGMGPAPSAEQLARRGHRIAALAMGQPNAQGDLDKAVIRKVVKAAKQKITYCYEKALLAKPTLAGTVQVQFFIKPDGTVPNAAANGVDPDVATCVADVIKSLTFPKPNGGGGVQVNYPFTMHQ